MEILNPIALNLMFAPVLLVIFYFLQGGKEKRKVDSLLFWDKLEDDSRTFSIRFKFERDLLFYLQLFIILLLIFALLRPVLTKEVQQTDRLIFVIDRSASLQSTDIDSNRFITMKKKLLEDIKSLTSNTKIALIEADNSPQIIFNFNGNKDNIIDYVENMRVSSESLNVEETFELIKMLNNDSNITYFYSDGALNFEKEEYKNIFKKDNFNLVKFGNDIDNIGITNFSIQEKKGLPGQYRCFLEVSNFSSENKEVEIEVKKERMIILKDRFIINSGEKFKKEYDLKSEEGNLFQILLDPQDQFLVDNQIEFRLGDELADEFSVALIGKENYFLERAFLVIPGVSFVKKNKLPEDYYDLYIFNEVSPPVNFEKNSIVINSNKDQEKKDNQIVDIMSWDKDHPIFRFVNFAELQIKNPNYDFISTESTKIVRSVKGPLMALVEEDNYKKLEIAFSLNNSNLLLQSSFPIFISNFIQWLKPNFMNAGYSKIKTGEEYKFIPSENSGIDSVINPKGNNIEYIKRNQYYYIKNTEDEGVYEIKLDNGKKEYFSANLLSEKESRLNNNLKKQDISNLETDTAKDNTVIYQSLWPYLLLIILFLLVIEWVLTVKRGSN